MNIAVVFGGKSTEYSISCMSASFVLSNLSGHNVIKLGITREGKWYKTDADLAAVKSGAWSEMEENLPVSINLNGKCFDYGTESFLPDVIFPVLHGKNGEDGTVQGLFELMGVPYVGSRVLGSALCMDKIAAKAVLAHGNITQVPYVVIDVDDCLESALEKIDIFLQYPVFVKPANAGSSIGITKCISEDDVAAALTKAFAVDRRVLIEQGLENIKEVEVALMGNDDVISSVTGMICPSNEFYDYNAKYIDEASLLVIPSRVPQEKQIKAIAEKAYRLCDCKGLARVDFMIDSVGYIYLNEINTMPGFTPISMFPKLFEVSGISTEALIDNLLDLAIHYNT